MDKNVSQIGDLPISTTIKEKRGRKPLPNEYRKEHIQVALYIYPYQIEAMGGAEVIKEKTKEYIYNLVNGIKRPK